MFSIFSEQVLSILRASVNQNVNEMFHALLQLLNRLEQSAGGLFRLNKLVNWQIYFAFSDVSEQSLVSLMIVPTQPVDTVLHSQVQTEIRFTRRLTLISRSFLFRETWIFRDCRREGSLDLH